MIGGHDRWIFGRQNLPSTRKFVQSNPQELSVHNMVI